MQGKLVVCPVCGTKMQIPPGYERMAARCRSCNTVLNQGPQLAMAGGLGAITPTTTVAQPAAPETTQSAAEYVRCHLKSALLSTFLWGSGGAMAGGIFMAVISVALMHGTDTAQMRAGVFGGAEFGAFAGFLLGCTWGMVSTLDMTFAVGAGIAAGLGFILSVTHHLVEANLIAPPDDPIYLTGLVGFCAGAFIGVVSVWFKNYRAEA